MLELWGYGEYTGRGAGPIMVTAAIYAMFPFLLRAMMPKVTLLDP
jgi:hypothetical protein